jgi:fatty-acyl-CoA synthase
MTQSTANLSIVHGLPLREEPGLGALTIGGYAREVTTRFAEREALVFHGHEGVVRWSYAEVWQRAVEVAKALIAAGVTKDTRVGLLLTNRPEYISNVFGIALAGGVTVALNTFSTKPELEYLLKASNVSVLLFERQVANKSFAAMLEELEPELSRAAPLQLVSRQFPFLRRVVMLDDGDPARPRAVESYRAFLHQGAEVDPQLVEARAATTKPADLGVLFFSSGSTGMPKCIVHGQRAVTLQWWRWPALLKLGNDVRCWTANGFFWSANFSLQFGSAFTSGGAIVLQSTFNAEEALELIQAERVTFPVFSVHQQSRMAAASNFDKVDLSGVRYLNHVSPLMKHPTVRANWRQASVYGTTETLTGCTAYPSGTADDARPGYGLPLPGNTVKIIDPDSGALIPRGERGEIAVKGPTLMLGYLGKTSDEVFDEDGYYRTGDGGYVDESGWLYFEGRLSDIIKTGGANVSPLEIDAVIRTYPGVKITQTIGLAHRTLGEIVVACIVPHAGVSLSEAPLREFLKERLASYKLPRRILFLRDDEVALTGSDKVKAGLLRTHAAQRLRGVEEDLLGSA